MSNDDQGVPDDVATTMAPTAGFSVGAALREGRLRLGKDIPQVAEKLRIRQVFIEALEDGRHKDLPGGAYAIGFLRSYAEFLGLDGEEMVRRFKQEAAGDLSAHSELQFPSPVSEGRMPTAPVLLIGLVVAVVAYGLWWSLGTKHDSLSELVPAVPERLAVLLHRPAGVAPQEPAPAAEQTQAAPEQTNSAPPAEVATASSAAPIPEINPPAPGAVPAVPEPTAAAPAAPAAPLPATPAQAPAAGAAPAHQPTPPASSVPAQSSPVQPVPAPSSSAPAPAAPTPAASAPAPAAASQSEKAAPKVVEGASDARVVLQAVKDDCWIQIRESDGQLVTSRLLRKGDTYRVPDRPGLTLTAGNAGALNVAIDGQDVGPLGSSKQVRRDVSLDPAKLRK